MRTDSRPTYLLDTPRHAQLGILPESLNRALDALEEANAIREALGAHICDRFISAERLEWEDYRLSNVLETTKYLPDYWSVW